MQRVFNILPFLATRTATHTHIYTCLCRHALSIPPSHMLARTHARTHARTRTRTRTHTHTPAVSHIVSFTFFPSTSIDFTLKSTPMVAGWSAAKESSVKRNNMLDLPTPLFVRRHGVLARTCVFTACKKLLLCTCVFFSLSARSIALLALVGRPHNHAPLTHRRERPRSCNGNLHHQAASRGRGPAT